MEPSGPYPVPNSLTEGKSALAATEVATNDAEPFLLTQTAAEPFVDPPRLRVVAHSDEVASRALDLILATSLLIFVLPLMTLCALAVLCSGPGPLFFRQTRIGRDGRSFTCLKFRTMVDRADAAIAEILRKSARSEAEWQALQKLTHDPRVTPVGRVLRRYCLDELPQLFNVLAGDMSVVGPRPIVAAEVSRYGPNFADYCSVRPGLTGLWQVSGRHALSYAQRVELDTQYARSKSVRLDLLILARTVPIVFLGENM